MIGENTSLSNETTETYGIENAGTISSIDGEGQ